MFGQLFRLVQLVFHQGGNADDGVHGGTDVVAHVGEEVRLGLAGALCGLQSLCCNDLRLPQLIIYLRQMDVVLFQTEVCFFFSPQLLLLLLPQEKPADKNCYDREHHRNDDDDDHDDVD